MPSDAETYRHFIDGEWVEGSSGETFESIDPATEETLGIFQKGNEEDAKAALDAAEDNLRGWREIPAPRRGEILLKTAEIMRERKEELAQLMTREMGKVIEETRGDVQEAIDMFEYMAGEGRRLYGVTTPSELPEKFCMTIKQPVGVCSVITPWNFPIAIPAWKLAPALVAGNTVAFKPASDTPLCAVRLVEILDEAGLPGGVVNLVTGPGSTVGKELVTSDTPDMVSFTGHKDTGQWIRENAGLKKVGLEMGGKNPIIVMDDADLKLALDGVIWGAFGTTGQRCTAASRVILEEGVHDEFQEMLVKRAKELKLGHGLEEETDVGPLINEQGLEKSVEYTEIAEEEGAEILTGGERHGEKGFFYKPTVFGDVTADMQVAQDEIFGPSTALIRSSDVEEAIEAANSIKYGLSSSIYTQDINRAHKAIEWLEAGLTYVNASTIGSEIHLPFGGVKNTGTGTREGGGPSGAIEEFTETKTVYIDYSGKLQRAQIDIEGLK